MSKYLLCFSLIIVKCVCFIVVCKNMYFTLVLKMEPSASAVCASALENESYDEEPHNAKDIVGKTRERKKGE